VFGRSLGLLAHDATVAGAIAAARWRPPGSSFTPRSAFRRAAWPACWTCGAISKTPDNALDFAARAKRSRLMELAIADAEATAVEVGPRR